LLDAVTGGKDCVLPGELLDAGAEGGEPDTDFKPVVKLLTPDAQCTWLLTEFGNDDIAYGVCDLGLAVPEIGFVCMGELAAKRAVRSVSPSSATNTSKATRPPPPAPTRRIAADTSSLNAMLTLPEPSGRRLFAVRRHVCFLQAGDQSRPQRQHHCPYGAGLWPMH